MIPIILKGLIPGPALPASEIIPQETSGY